MSNPKESTLTVPVRIYEPGTLFLRQSIGDGETPDGKRIEVSQNLGSGHFMCRIGKGPWYTLSPAEFAEAVHKHMKQEAER